MKILTIFEGLKQLENFNWRWGWGIKHVKKKKKKKKKNKKPTITKSTIFLKKKTRKIKI